MFDHYLLLVPHRHWHRPFVRETNDTSDFVCKPFDSDNDGIVPLLEIEDGLDL